MGVVALTAPPLAMRRAACRPRGASAPVLRNIDLEVPEGTTLVVLGGNGAGKSTLLRVAAGLLPPDEGAVLHDGAPVAGFDPGATALITDDPRRQFVASTVLGEIEFALESRLDDAARIRELSVRALEEFGIAALRDRDPLRLSAGEQQLALLAAALAPGPRLLLLDDPFLYLDPGAALACWSNVVRMVARGRIAAAVLATHDVELAATADAAAILDGGGLATWGDPGEVLRGAIPDGLTTPLGIRLERSLDASGRPLVPGAIDVPALAARVAWSSRLHAGSSC